MYASSLRRTLLTLIGLVAASTASAGTISSWQGSGASNNWNAAGNWSTVLGSGTTYSLQFGGSTRTTNTNNIPSLTVDSISFLNTSGSTFIVNGSSVNSLLLTNSSTFTTAAASAVMTDSFNAAVTSSGTINFQLGQSHYLNFNPVAVTGTAFLVKSGAGTLNLGGSAARSFSGVRVDQGNVNLNTAAARNSLAGRTVNLAGANTFFALNSGASGTNTILFDVAANSNVGASAGAEVVFASGTLNNSVSTSTNVTLTLRGDNNALTQVVEGAIVDNNPGTVGVTIGGSNAWILNGINTYTGNTTVNAGARLLMNGQVNSSSNTTSSGYLGGSGTFGGAVSILSGTLSPGGTSTQNQTGVINDTIGNLTVGSLSLGPTALAAMTITGSTAGSFDQITVSGGSINYGGTLALTLSGSYVDDTSFNLFSGITNPIGDLNFITLSATGSPYVGLTFSNYGATNQDVRDEFGLTAGDWITDANSSMQRLKFSQSTGTLTVVPEPSTIVFAGIGMAMFGWSTWTRRRAKARRQLIEASIA